jgi:double-stranded uracil-DNA glycosylase
MTDGTASDRSNWSADVLATGLDVVFCGINPATTAAVDGHNFSHPSNRFWAVIHRAGFTPVRLIAAHERDLLRYGCGITAVVTRPTPRASDLSAEEIHAARSAFETKIQLYRPRVIAFLGKRAISVMLAERNVEYGPLATTFAGAAAWVLPNPSGLNRRFSLDALTHFYRELHVASVLDRDVRPRSNP